MTGRTETEPEENEWYRFEMWWNSWEGGVVRIWKNGETTNRECYTDREMREIFADNSERLDQ